MDSVPARPFAAVVAIAALAPACQVLSGLDGVGTRAREDGTDASLAQDCCAADGGTGGSANAGGASADDGSSGGSSNGGTAGAGASPQAGGSGGISGAGGSCPWNDDQDHDKDGYTGIDGDCNDCNPGMNAGAFDFPNNGSDEDCSGTPDDEVVLCDTGLSLDDTEAIAAAKAIGLCRSTTESATGQARTWGVLPSAYVLADGVPGMNPLSHGLLGGLGAAVVQHGESMLALSSGTARAPGQAGYQAPDGAKMGTACSPPIPNMDSPLCPGAQTGDPHDCAALALRLRAPSNAKGFRFVANFFAFGFPQAVCKAYNDFFAVLVDPKPAGSLDGNVALVGEAPISINSCNFSQCSPGTYGGKSFACTEGLAGLQGTGFESHAATGWTQYSSSVEPGSIVSVRFAVWDSGDELEDVVVLIDGFEWTE